METHLKKKKKNPIFLKENCILCEKNVLLDDRILLIVYKLLYFFLSQKKAKTNFRKKKIGH